MTAGNTDHPHLRDEASTDALPIAPALGVSLDAARMPRRSTLVEPRVCHRGLALVLGVAAAFIAQLLVALIALVTNLAFYGALSATDGVAGGQPSRRCG